MPFNGQKRNATIFFYSKMTSNSGLDRILGSQGINIQYIEGNKERKWKKNCENSAVVFNGLNGSGSGRHTGKISQGRELGANRPIY